jgi:hypothetical protein
MSNLQFGSELFTNSLRRNSLDAIQTIKFSQQISDQLGYPYFISWGRIVISLSYEHDVDFLCLVDVPSVSSAATQLLD